MVTIKDKELIKKIVELVDVDKALIIRVDVRKEELWVLTEQTQEEKARTKRLINELKETVGGKDVKKK